MISELIPWNGMRTLSLLVCRLLSSSANPLDINNRVQTTMTIEFDKPFWDRGAYPAFWVNRTETQRLLNPWLTANNNAAPFDQCE